MNSAVATVLNKVLGEYVQDLNASQLNTSILGGDIKLKNTRVKPEALKKFGFPFVLKSGLIGNLNVSIGDNNLDSCLQFFVTDDQGTKLLNIKFYDKILDLVSKEATFLVSSRVSTILGCKRQIEAFER